MLKKLLLMIAVLMPFISGAQQIGGEWYTYPIYTGYVNQMVEAPGGKLYFLAGVNLYSYDAHTNELYSYSKRNLLNDNAVAKIFYNYNKNYLAVVYDNCNIDLIYDNGKVANLSDIADAVMMTPKTINDLCFDGDRIYVATSFGLVVFNDNKYYVEESGIYNKAISTVAVVDGHVVMFCKDDAYIYFSPVDKKHFSLDSFGKSQWTANVYKFFTLPGDNTLYGIFKGDKYDLRACKFNFDNGSYSHTVPASDLKSTYNCWVDKDGYLNAAKRAADNVYRIKDGELKETVTLPAPLAKQYVTAYESPSKMWLFADKKLSYYNVDGSNATALLQPFEPEGVCRVQKVGYILPSFDYQRIYVSPVGKSQILNVNANEEGTDVYGYVNMLSDGELLDISAYDAPALSRRAKYYQNGYGHTMPVAPCDVVECPEDPEAYYICSGFDGVLKIKDGTVVERYNDTNSPLTVIDGSADANTWGGLQASAIAIDKEGNLWLAHFYHTLMNGSEYLAIACLPREKRLLPSSQVQIDDWTNYPLVTCGNRDVQILPCRKSNMVFVLCSYFQTHLYAFDTKGNTDPSDDSYLLWRNINDQDGKQFTFYNNLAMTEDLDGRVWVTSNARGTVMIPDPTQATNPEMTLIKVKVPRNDGTDFADYLFETENITSITVDPSNRKWFGTMDSGIYLTSPDGDAVLAHYTTENSFLPSNKVISIYADRLSNKVYVGTEYGLTVFNSTSAPASEDFNNVYAYPNPVRPEYTGWVTINGLMENSLVKITDAMGQVVYQGRSEGGMMMWDGCDSGGNRVKSGVYYVYASAGNADASSGKVATKILVVN